MLFLCEGKSADIFKKTEVLLVRLYIPALTSHTLTRAVGPEPKYLYISRDIYLSLYINYSQETLTVA